MARSRASWIIWAMGIGLAAIPAARAQQEPAKKAADHATVEKEGARGRATPPVTAGHITWPGMTREGTVLLPNGWSLKPAGRQSKLGDFPVQIAPHPSKPILAVLHAGYGEHEVVTVDGANGHVIGRAAIPETFAGMTWSADGKQIFVGGGFDDLVYRFDHADGLLAHKVTFEYPDRKESLANNRRGGRLQRTPAGLAVTSDG